MSEKQDNQMEQWLKEYAQRRRGELDEPIELHEATRTMLQGEVSRVYPKSVVTRPESQGSSAWLAWAIGGATVGVAALVITYNSNLPQDPDPMKMAKADEEQLAAAEEMGQAGESEKASEDSASKFKETGKTETAEVRDNEEGNSPARRIVLAVVKDDPRMSGSVKGNPGSAPREVPGTTTSNHITPKAEVAGGFAPRPVNVQKRGATFYNNISNLRQDFTQTDLSLANRQNGLPKAVLMNFQVQRIGNLVDVVDQDGSEYTGIVINEEQYGSETEDKAVPAKLLPAANAGADALGAPAVAIRSTAAQRGRASREQFHFRVQGFNLTLGKEVILEATLDSPPEKLIEASQLTAPSDPTNPRDKSKDREQKNKQAKELDKLTKELAEKKTGLAGRNFQAVRAIARMRVLGNARIEKANYAVDAYQQQLFLPAKAMLKAEPLKKK